MWRSKSPSQPSLREGVITVVFWLWIIKNLKILLFIKAGFLILKKFYFEVKFHKVDSPFPLGRLGWDFGKI